MKHSYVAIAALHRECAICGSSRGEILHTQRFLPVEDSPLPSSYDVVTCCKCGFVFADVEATQRDYDIFYSQLSKYENEGIAGGSGLCDWDHRRLSETATELERHLSPSARILDIGSAQGGLLDCLRERGFYALAALEPSALCMAKMNHIRGFVGSLHSDFAAVFGSERFDSIVLSHVLEHVYDMSGAISNITSILADDGLLYIEVPNASRYHDYFKTSYHYFDVEHINHFDLSSLNTLFGLHGLEAVASGTKEMEISDAELYPAIFSVFRRKRIGHEVRRYVELSDANDNSAQLTALAETGGPIAIWGFGSYTKRLLATTDLRKCDIRHIVDGDPKKHGTSAGPLPVESPTVLKTFKGTIVIASAIYSNAIESVAAEMGLLNETIVLR